MTQLTKNTPVVFHFRYVELPWEFKTKGINRKLTHCGDKDFHNHSPFGGITVIYHPEMKCFTVAVCSTKDNFNRKVGTKAALDRFATTVPSNLITTCDSLPHGQAGSMNEMNKNRNEKNSRTRMRYLIGSYRGDTTLEAVRSMANRIAELYMEC